MNYIPDEMQKILHRITTDGGISYTELSKILGVSRMAIYTWTKGSPPHHLRIPAIEKIFKAVDSAILVEDLPVRKKYASKDLRLADIKSVLIKHLKLLAK